MVEEGRHPALARLDVLPIGLGDAADQFTVLYADARGVLRVYAMTFDDGTWTMWRNAAGFHQRFTATLDRDANTVDGRWEMSRDGETWNLDFEVGYTRQA